MSWSRAPVTWAIYFLSFVMTVYSTTMAPTGLEEIMRNPYFLKSQGQFYAQYLSERAGSDYPELLRQLGQQVSHGETDSRELGELAFRDSDFYADAEGMDFDGDQVALKLWRRDLRELRDIEDRHPSFELGLSARDLGLEKWVSYIFVHSGWFHFFGNMLVFLIYGAALEAQIGGLGLLVVYLLSGLVAAGFFALLTGVANSPLVGGSGAVSGIVALFSVLNWSRPARFFYWFFLPFRGYMGLVYLPAWVGLALWAVGDIAGYLGSLPELGGIAHAAHLGGELAGCVVGVTLLTIRRRRPVPVRPLVPTSAAMGVLMPFLPAHSDRRAA